MPLNLKDRWASFVDPIELFYYGFRSFFQAVKDDGISSLPSLRDVAFHRLYRFVSQGFSNFENSQGVPNLIASAYGTVLELGPATGNQLPRFDFLKVKHVYGVEPNVLFEQDLRAKSEELGISDKYTPIMCSIENREVLGKYGLKEESVDCVVSMQVLCSVKDLEMVSKDLYRLLKPGGEIILWEHQRSRDRVTRILQKLWNLPWSCAFSGCRLDKQIEKYLLKAGRWKSTELERDVDPHSLFPRVWGRLVKA